MKNLLLGSHPREKLKVENFTLSFGRYDKDIYFQYFVLHIHHDYFSSFNQLISLICRVVVVFAV